jgi:hypothetical protein
MTAVSVLRARRLAGKRTDRDMREKPTNAPIIPSVY